MGGEITLVIDWIHQTSLGSSTPSNATFAEVVEIGMDCIAPPRRQTLEVLIDTKGSLKTIAISEKTGYPVNSARRILEELKAIGMVERQLSGSTYWWTLSKEATEWHNRAVQ